MLLRAPRVPLCFAVVILASLPAGASADVPLFGPSKFVRDVTTPMAKWRHQSSPTHGGWREFEWAKRPSDPKSCRPI